MEYSFERIAALIAFEQVTSECLRAVTQAYQKTKSEKKHSRVGEEDLTILVKAITEINKLELSFARENFWTHKDVQCIFHDTAYLCGLFRCGIPDPDNFTFNENQQNARVLTETLFNLYQVELCPVALEVILSMTDKRNNTVLRLAFDVGADPNTLLLNGKTLLQGHTHSDATKRWMIADPNILADPNTLNANGENTLFFFYEKPIMLKTLMTCGASVNVRNKDGKSPIYRLFVYHDTRSLSSYMEVLDEMMFRSIDVSSHFPLSFVPKKDKETGKNLTAPITEYLKMMNNEDYNRFATVYFARITQRFPIEVIGRICSYVTSVPLGKIPNVASIIESRDEEQHWRLVRKVKFDPKEKERTWQELRNMIRLRELADPNETRRIDRKEVEILTELKMLAVHRRREHTLDSQQKERCEFLEKQYRGCYGSKLAVKMIKAT